MNIKPVQTRKIYQEIIGSFVELIYNEELKIGDKLPSERELCERFQVSRPSVREALRVMQAVGLITIRAGGGAYLTEFNIEPFLNLFAPLFCRRPRFGLELLEIRELIEVKAVELAVKNSIEGLIDNLKKILEMMKLSIEKGDNALGVEADIQFHQAIIHHTENSMLIKASELVNTLMEISIKDARALVLKRAEGSMQLFLEHKAIYDGILQHSRDDAVEAMKKHLEMVRGVYTEYYQHMDGSA
jgi:GntR family transcriptional repressor for pyruvate dehydrogenase complex